MKFSAIEWAVGLALLTGQVDAFWRMECRGVSGLARIDPLVNPGAMSSHAHTIAGGSAFSSTSGTAELQNSDCTSCAVTQDNSAYWTPTLYFKNSATGEFTLVNQVGGMLAYYFLNYSPGESRITAYPKGFSMIAGETKARSDKGTLEAKALGFNCMNYTPGRKPEDTLGRHHMPTKDFMDANCKDGIRAELMFPSCWDGKGLNGGASNKAHVAYPDGVMTGSCPPEFPVRLPGLMYETQWDTNAFNGIAGEFVWSNGDPTGYGYHGDFITGWDTVTLQAAVDTCTNISGRIEDCPIFNIQPRATSEQCFLQNGQGFTEQLAGPLSQLPGKSPVSYGPEDASGAAAAAPAAPPAKVAAVESPSAKAVEAEAAPSPAAPAPSQGGVFAEEGDAKIKAAVAPSVTPAPVAIKLEEGQKISTTIYKTIGENEVVEVLVIEEIVTVTEDVVTMTEYKTVNAYAPAKRAHGHARRHAHHA